MSVPSFFALWASVRGRMELLLIIDKIYVIIIKRESEPYESNLYVGVGG